MRVRFRLVVALSFVSSVGCATIAGLDDLQLIDCPGDASCPGAAGGEAGTSAGGAAGLGGATGGKAGVAGNAGAAGVAGTAGAAGAPGGAAGAAGVGGAAGVAGSAGFGGAVMMGGSAGVAGAAGSSGSATCVPKTCAELGAECGNPPDGCGGTAKCSTCADPKLSCGVTTATGLVPFVCGCAPNTYKCDGASLYQCTPDGQAFLLAATCGSAAQCNPGTPPTTGGSGGAGGAGGASGAAGAGGSPGSPGVPGTCMACTAGSTLCQGLQPFTCAGGTFSKKGAACVAGDTGAGVCDPSNGGTCHVCAPNAFACNGPKLQQCDATGNTLTDKATCASAALCAKSVYAGSCAPPVCQAGERRCVGDMSQICGPNRDQFVDDKKCASAALCGNGSCNPPACEPGETKCAGNTLQKCKADQTGFEKQKDCFSMTPACDLVSPGAGQPAVAACTVRGPALAGQAQAAAYIHSLEVRNEDYNVFLAANVSVATQSAECSWNADFGVPVQPGNLPRVDVDWCDAKAYCSWAGMQLCGRIGKPGEHVTPGEAGNAAVDQWLAFCGGKDNTAYPYGNTFNEAACNGPTVPPAVSPAAVPAGSRPGCALAGLIFDMSGNVAEWEDACTGYTGPKENCLARGGSFASPTETSVKCSAGGDQPTRDTRRPDLGFRCCVQ